MAVVRVHMIDGNCLSVRINGTKESVMNLLAEIFNDNYNHLRFEEDGLVIPMNSILYIEVDEDAD